MAEAKQDPSATPRKTARMQHVLTVDSTQWLGPHLIRVVAGGPSLADFAHDGNTDAYVKLMFADPALGLEPPYDIAALRETLPAEQLPVTRTYTVRWFDASAQKLAIDFVVHGDTGIAAPWAANAKPGDRFALSGPGSGFKPDTEARWHVFVGDLSGLPAISCAIESLPAEAEGVAHLEITQTDDIIEIANVSKVRVEWLLNPDASDAEFLARCLQEGQWPQETNKGAGVQVFAHGERESIKAVRRALAQREVPREAISISGYWARGRTEDIFQAEKREPIGKID
ncbi:MAG: siderophore-interacting protein [Actinomycetota bacterium]|nr:siderophore-interacting protein [Actinomycetota bacterium]